MIEIRSLRDLLRLLFIYQREFLWAAGITMALAIAGAFLLPTRYASEARLLVKPGRENLTVPIDAGDRPTVVPQSTQRDPIVDEEKMLTGRPVVQKVVQHYMAHALGEPPSSLWGKVKHAVKSGVAATLNGLRQVLVWVGLTEPRSPEERLAEKFTENFDVSHASGSSVMELRFVWDDPAHAQALMEAWVRAYQEERARVLGRQTLTVFYETKSSEAGRQIEELKRGLRAQLQQIRGLSAEERLESITDRLNRLRSQRAELLAERDALAQGISFSRDRAASLPKEQVQEREVGLGPTWLALNTQLAELKRQRVDLLRIYKVSAPPLQSLEQSIHEVEAQLKAEERNVQRSQRLQPNELTSTLARNDLEKSVRLAELKTFLASYDKEAEQLEEERRTVLANEPELARLSQALAVAEKNRALYLESLERARIEQALDDNRISNVAVVESATFNPARVFPHSLALLMMALPFGALVGLVTVYLCSLFDQRIHDGGRLEQRFGVPLWSTIKDIRNAEKDNEFFASLYRIHAMLPLDQVAEKGLTVGFTSSRPREGVTCLVGELAQLLQQQGLRVCVGPDSGRAVPGEVALLPAGDLLGSREALLKLGKADLVILVVSARTSTVPVVENALNVLRTAFRKVDGLILNRRYFELPPAVLRFLQR